jgi:2-polyprenyl-6-methoxyphenol hydroxylase-like FAD-dependent oxidoreductase
MPPTPGEALLTTDNLADRAVVVGSGMAGLFAARVLSDHVEEVVLIDRDHIPDSPEVRDGVPQAHHFHGLLSGGLAIADELFPGFVEDLEVAGAVPCVAGRDFVAWGPQGKSYALGTFQPEPIPIGTFYVMSRPLLEHCVRRRVEALGNVTTRYESLVREPVAGEGGIRGVVMEGGGRLDADLVVDATGRNSRTGAWLDALGWQRPPESVVNCDFAYASAVLRPRDPDAIDGVGFFVLPDPAGEHASRGAYLVRIEKALWLGGLGGRFGDYPPADIDGFRAFGRTLLHPIWDEMVSTAELVTRPATFRFPRSIRRRFETLDDFPDGLLPLGDAVCHFNPLYGQGMSSAALQAKALGQLLDRRAQQGHGLAGLALEFFPQAFEVTRTPWALAAAVDFADSRTTGDFPSEEMKSLVMFQLLASVATTHPEAAKLAFDIVTLQRPLDALHEPPWPERLGFGAAQSVT